jgi:hypothetical protein
MKSYKFLIVMVVGMYGVQLCPAHFVRIKPVSFLLANLDGGKRLIVNSIRRHPFISIAAIAAGASCTVFPIRRTIRPIFTKMVSGFRSMSASILKNVGIVCASSKLLAWSKSLGANLDTLLWPAIMNNNTQRARVLINAGADVSARNDRNLTPLYYAAIHDRWELAGALMRAGANVSAQEADGQTPLHRAAEMGNLRMVQLLMRYGADINVQDNSGNTPLHNVGGTEAESVRNYLLLHGAR